MNELALLIAEQERDDRYGHRVFVTAISEEIALTAVGQADVLEDVEWLPRIAEKSEVRQRRINEKRLRRQLRSSDSERAKAVARASRWYVQWKDETGGRTVTCKQCGGARKVMTYGGRYDHLCLACRGLNSRASDDVCIHGHVGQFKRFQKRNGSMARYCKRCIADRAYWRRKKPADAPSPVTKSVPVRAADPTPTERAEQSQHA